MTNPCGEIKDVAGLPREERLELVPVRFAIKMSEHRAKKLIAICDPPQRSLAPRCIVVLETRLHSI
jgi:hypothetical protein